MKAIFNHDSLLLLFPDASSAQIGIEKFIKIISRFAEFNLEIILMDDRFGGSFFNIELSSNYFWRDWSKWAEQKPLLRDPLLRFKSFATKTSMSLFNEKETYESLAVEVGLKGEDHPRISLLAAYFHKSFLISFPNEKPWSSSQIEVWIIDLNSESETQIDNFIPNIFDEKSFDFHLPELKKKRNESMKTGTEIWKKRKQFFPNLVLSSDVGRSLKAAGFTSGILNKFREILVVINHFSTSWRISGVSYSDAMFENQGVSVKISGESDTVCNNPKLRRKRMFWIDGEERYCEKHIKFAQGIRVHFYPCDETQTVHIVYFGPHLATKNF